MILLVMSGKDYYALKIKNTIELVKALDKVDVVIKIYNDDEVISPPNYVIDYDLYIHNNHALITKQSALLNDVEMNRVHLETSWEKKVSPTALSTGPSFYTGVLDLDNDGMTLEDYYVSHADKLYHDAKAHIAFVDDRYKSEEKIYSDFRKKEIAKPDKQIDEMSNDYLSVEMIALDSIANNIESSLTDTLIEIDLFVDFVVRMKRNLQTI